MVSGKDLISRLSQIVSAGRRTDESFLAETRDAAKFTAKIETKTETKVESKAAASEIRTGRKIDPRAVAAAAEAFAERLRMKVHGLAA